MGILGSSSEIGNMFYLIKFLSACKSIDLRTFIFICGGCNEEWTLRYFLFNLMLGDIFKEKEQILHFTD